MGLFKGFRPPNLNRFYLADQPQSRTCSILEGTLSQRIATRFSGRFPIFKEFAYAPDLSTQNSIPIVLEQMGEVAVPHLPRMRRIFLAAPIGHLNLLNAMGKIGRDDPDTGAFLISVGLNPSMPASVRGNCAAFLGTRNSSEENVEALTQFYSDQIQMCKNMPARHSENTAPRPGVPFRCWYPH